MFDLDKYSVVKLHELADLQHPHMKGSNHTRQMIDKVYNHEKLTIDEAFDCGKYYERMLDQLDLFENDRDLKGDYISAILDFKHEVYQQAVKNK